MCLTINLEYFKPTARKSRSSCVPFRKKKEMRSNDKKQGRGLLKKMNKHVRRFPIPLTFRSVRGPIFAFSPHLMIV